MTNPFSGIISTEFKAIFNNAIDALLEDNALTIPCRLTYTPGKSSACPNCTFDPATGLSANQYNGTGPRPFTTGTICPVCGGRHSIFEETTETIYLAVLFGRDAHNFIKNLKVNIDLGDAISISRNTVYEKLRRTRDVVFDTNVEGLDAVRYQRKGRPMLIGFGDSRYIIVSWERSG